MGFNSAFKGLRQYTNSHGTKRTVK